MHEQDSTPNGDSTDHGRRGFLSAAALAATSLVAVSGAAPQAYAAPSATDIEAPTRRRNQVTAAITQTGHRRLGSLKVSSIGLGTQTMPGNLYGPVTSRTVRANCWATER